MLTVEVAINGSPAWLVTASRRDGVAAGGVEGGGVKGGGMKGGGEGRPHTYEVKVFDAEGLETLRVAGGEPRPLVVTEVDHTREDGALALAAAATSAIAAAAGSGEVDQRLRDRIAPEA